MWKLIETVYTEIFYIVQRISIPNKNHISSDQHVDRSANTNNKSYWQEHNSDITMNRKFKSQLERFK